MPGQVRQVQCTEYTSTTAVLGTLALRIAYAAYAPCVLYYMTLAAWH